MLAATLVPFVLAVLAAPARGARPEACGVPGKCIEAVGTLLGDESGAIVGSGVPTNYLDYLFCIDDAIVARDTLCCLRPDMCEELERL
ncbi:hypothetical protein PsYK624_151340 [Phanerochaete sordida]|uniref:Hydrophobin n=1 Tax=Phanerochaete sordida TaxID=48140 RepID=A0A9P3GN83_9APHY|nr:hypothetical protein PsYK624_151340 [Phanerochaete sordida]